jgi:nicotinate-nucleotide adenylyltransferase
LRLGIFGGTFDPIHLGHLRLAEEAREHLALDRVLFVPNRVSPFKTGRTTTPPDARLEMARRAVADNPAFAVSAVEVERSGGPSYTIDTVRVLRAEHGPRTEMHLLTGTDAVRDLPGWREPDALLSLVQIAAAARPGVDKSAVLASLSPAWAARIAFIPMTALDISASDLRARVAAGRSITYLVPRAVETFIREHGLYAASKPRKEDAA